MATAAIAVFVVLATAESSVAAGSPEVGRVRENGQIVSRAKQLCALRPSVSASRRDDSQRVNQILRGRVTLMGSPLVAIGSAPTWREAERLAPFQTTLHGLTWTDALRRRWLATGNHMYLARYERLLRAWATTAGDYRQPVTRWAWYDMAQGQRAAVFTCAVSVLGPRPWLMHAIRTALNVLRDVRASHYDAEGNHSLWQDMGLMTLSRLLGDDAGERMALRRLGQLLSGAVSVNGESTEGASVYQELNWLWWSEAERLAAPAVIPGGSRITAMAQVYADLVTPSGKLLAFGDSQVERAAVNAGDTPEPRRLALMPELGLAQARDQQQGSMVAIRYGAAGTRQLHGHRDAGSLQVHMCGRTLLGDSGMYAYAPATLRGQRARRFVQSAAAHSVFLPNAINADPAQRTPLDVVDSGDVVLLKVRVPLLDGGAWTRRVYFSRIHGYVIVEDETTTSGKQVWQLPRGSAYLVDESSLTERVTGTCLLQMTWAAGTQPAVIAGDDGLGWMSEEFNKLVPRPVAVTRMQAGQSRAVLIQGAAAAEEAASSLTALGAHRYRVTRLGSGEQLDLVADLAAAP